MRQYYRAEEVAQVLGVTDQTIRNWIREGKINAKRFGRPFMIPLAEVARLLDTTPAAAAALFEQAEAQENTEENRIPVIVAA